MTITFAGRASTAAEKADPYDDATEYLAVIGWVGTLTTLGTPTDAALVAQATRNLPAPTNVFPTPDVGPNVVAGKGFIVTGIAPDPRDGTWWVMSHGRNVAVDGTSNGQRQIVHTAADRSTVVGTIDLNSLTRLTLTLMQGSHSTPAIIPCGR